MSPKIYVYDIETTPNLVYSWGLWQQNIGISQIVEPQDILCFAARKVGETRIEALAAWDDYEAMINRLWAIMDDADYLVGYNSASFDNKLVRAAFAKMQLPPPSPHRDIDLLRVVKKQFKFPSHKLDYVCKALGLDVKVQNGGMDTWIKCMDGDAAAQKLMIKYNKGDIRCTQQLFERLTPWIEGLNIPLYCEDDGETHCMRCDSTNLQSRGWAYTTTYRYRRYACMDCGGWMRSKKCEPTSAELRNA